MAKAPTVVVSRAGGVAAVRERAVLDAVEGGVGAGDEHTGVAEAGLHPARAVGEQDEREQGAGRHGDDRRPRPAAHREHRGEGTVEAR